jgi:tetratricopeptide (TPR) repeat protein
MCLLALGLQPWQLCAAEEIQECPDMNEHMKTLQEGQSALGPQVHHSTNTRQAPYYGLKDGPGRLPSANTSRTAPLGDDRISSILDLWRAQETAYAFEGARDFASAKKVYDRMIEAERRIYGPNSTHEAETLEDVGSLEVIEVFVSQQDAADKRSTERRTTSKPMYSVYENEPSVEELWLCSLASARRDIIDAVGSRSILDQSSDPPNQRSELWKSAVSHFGKALQVRQQQSKPDPDLSYALMMASAIAECHGDQSPAEEFLKEACIADKGASSESMRGHTESFPTAVKALTEYCRRHKAWDLARSSEKQILSSEEGHFSPDALNVLLSAYLESGKNDDAIRLFDEAIDVRRYGRGLNLDPEVLKSMVKLVPDSSAQLLTEYLLSRVKAEAEGAKLWGSFEHHDFVTTYDMSQRHTFEELMGNSMHPNEIFLVMAEGMEKRGWNSAANSVYKALEDMPIRSSQIPELLKVADFYTREKNYAEVGLISNQIVGYVGQRSPKTKADCEAKLHQISPVISLLKSFDYSSNSRCALAYKKAVELQEFYETQGQKLDCLEVAQQLNLTGSMLENKDDYKMASKMYDETLEIQKKNLGADDPAKAEQYGELARVAASQGDEKGAEALYKQAIAIYEKHPDKAAHDHGVMLENYAEFLQQSNQTERADAIFEQARQLFIKLDKETAAAREKQKSVLPPARPSRRRTD